MSPAKCDKNIDEAITSGVSGDARFGALIEQYWQYALLAAVAIIRQCAEHSGTPLQKFVSDLAAASAIEIS